MTDGEQQQLGAADDGVGHAAAGFADRRRQLGEEVQGEAAAAVDEQIPQDEDQGSGGEQGAQSGDGQHDGVDCFAAECVQVAHS